MIIAGSGLRESGGFRWRRWYAPLVVAVALIADYASPAEMWTAALPLAFMAVLLIHRERRAALAVLFLSSWILLPTAAGVTATVEAIRGTRQLYAVQFDVPGLAPGEASERPGVVTRALGSYAALHNQLAVWHLHHGEACQQGASLLMNDKPLDYKFR